MARQYRGLRRQARVQGRLRYGPENEALDLLAQDNRRDFRETVGAQRGAARVIRSQARQGRRDVRDIYEDAGLTAVVREGLDSNPAARRLAEEMAEAETEMVQRGVDAQEGAAFAISRAVKEYRQDARRIADRKLSLKREKGVFVSSLLEQLIGERQAARQEAAAEQRKQQFDLQKLGMTLAQRERSSIRSQGIDPDTGKRIKGGKNSKPTGADRDAAATFGKASTWIGRIDNAQFRKKIPDGKARRRATAELLLAGDRQSGVPAIPRPILTAALDMHFDKHLSPNTVRMLRRLGINPARIPGVRGRTPRPGTRRVVQAPGANGQMRPG